MEGSDFVRKVKILSKSEAVQVEQSRKEGLGVVQLDGRKKGRFVPEEQRYNKYMSHPRHAEFPLPVWKLSKTMLENLNQYIVGKDKSPDEVRGILQKLMAENIASIELGNGYKFEIPKYQKSCMEYNETVAISLLRRGAITTRAFNDGRSRYTATKTAWTIQKICDNLECGRSMTKRGLMYSNKQLFGTNQKNSDRIINDICYIAECRRPSLYVFPAETGVVLGNIIIKLKCGRSLDCYAGSLIPNDLTTIEDIAVHETSPDIKYILVVEKFSMLHRLRDSGFHIAHSCIIVSGFGMAGLASREFLRLIKECTGLVVYGLCDPDPEGYKILTVYARGSIESAYDNFHTAVPSLRWVGLSLKDLEDYCPDLPFSTFLPFSASDHKTMKFLLKSKHLKLSDKWDEMLQHMKKSEKKASFEDLEWYGSNYFSHVVLPQLIDRASKEHD